MRVLAPQYQKIAISAAVCPQRLSVGLRGAVVSRAEPSTAVFKETHACEDEPASVHVPEDVKHEIDSEKWQASTPEVEAQGAPHLEDTAAFGGVPRWENNRDDFYTKEKPVLERHQFRCKVGDVVVGKVVYSGEKGAKVDLLDYPGVMGFMPADRGPYAIDDPFTRENKRPLVALGTIRRFKVLSIPSRMEVNGLGPLLSCMNLDADLLWHRLDQVFDECMNNREVVSVRVRGASKGGLVCSFSGIRGFIPVSHIPKPSSDTWWDESALEERYLNKSVEVVPLQVKRQRNSFTCSIRKAQATRALKKLKVGSLVWGTVQSVRSYGAFVIIDDTDSSALLHIKNISWDHVNDIDEHLTAGDRVRAVVVGMDEDYSRLSVSTKELEITQGDMLIDKEAVYENAEEGVKPFLVQVAEWEAQAHDQGSEQDWHDSADGASDHFSKW